jgi:hypothetical protein
MTFQLLLAVTAVMIACFAAFIWMAQRHSAALGQIGIMEHKTLDANDRAVEAEAERQRAEEAVIELMQDVQRWANQYHDLLTRTAVNSEFFVCGECRKIVQGVCLECALVLSNSSQENTHGPVHPDS